MNARNVIISLVLVLVSLVFIIIKFMAFAIIVNLF